MLSVVHKNDCSVTKSLIYDAFLFAVASLHLKILSLSFSFQVLKLFRKQEGTRFYMNAKGH